MNSKIIVLEKLSKILEKKKTEGKKIVLCHGVFDLLHFGHINHFREAKKNNHILVVSITPDKYVNKGLGRPAFNEKIRAMSLSELNIVDFVTINNSHSAVSVIKKLKPNIFCKGKEYKNFNDDVTNEIRNEVKEIKRIKGKVIFTGGKTFSSSHLINKYGISSSKDLNNNLKKIKEKFDFNRIKNVFKNIEKLKILIVGEIIIDKYVFCEALGKSGKEPVLVLQDNKTEEYLGGAAAIARHVSSFNKNITLFSMIGSKSEFYSKIRKNLSKKIKLKLLKKKNSPTILKTRFVDKNSYNKVLGVYNFNDEILDKSQENIQNKRLKKLLPKYDLVIVSDYGHGFITKTIAKTICSKSKFLALNAQINASNIGYHSMRNYKNIDCVIINQKELEMEFRDRSTSLKNLIKKLSILNNIKNLIVTQGREGATLFDKKSNKFFKCGAFAKQVIDKVGAGDAFLSLASLIMSENKNKQLALIVGSLAAAQSTEDMGNKNQINKTNLLKTLEHILK